MAHRESGAPPRNYWRQGAPRSSSQTSSKLGDETVKAIEAAGGRAAFVKADVTNEDDARRMLDTAIAEIRRAWTFSTTTPASRSAFPAIRKRRSGAGAGLSRSISSPVILGCHLAAP